MPGGLWREHPAPPRGSKGGQQNLAKHIFVTGGVASSLGKGLTAASLGRLLKARGLRVTMQKLDPYINVDPGTMNPFQHGEVFVTDDVKARIVRVAEDADVVITEVGGTVGDIESLPFLEAIRQLRHDIGREHVFFCHVSLVPYIGPSGELKTKPTQHSVRELRSLGIQPDAIVCRTDRPITDALKRKISLLSDVDVAAVVSAPDADSIYEIPLVLHAEGLDDYLVRHLRLEQQAAPEPDLAEWEALVKRIRDPRRTVRIALVGKYVNLPDAYLSVTQALAHAGAFHGVEVEVVWIGSDDLEDPQARKVLETIDGVLVPGGFGVRGVEGKIEAVRYAREQGVPFLGICLGLQTAVIEIARHLAGLENANSSEFDLDTPYPVIDLLPDQRRVADMGGTMRLGLDPCRLLKGSRAEQAYGDGWRRPGWSARAPPLTAGWWRSSSCANTPGSWPASSTPSSARGRPAPTRCSATSSARRPPWPTPATPPGPRSRPGSTAASSRWRPATATAPTARPPPPPPPPRPGPPRRPPPRRPGQPRPRPPSTSPTGRPSGPSVRSRPARSGRANRAAPDERSRGTWPGGPGGRARPPGG